MSEEKKKPEESKLQGTKHPQKKRRRPKTKSEKTKRGDQKTKAVSKVGRPGSLILPRSKGQGINITLMPGVDKTQPIGNLLSEGLELRLIDINQKNATASLSFYGSDLFYVRRDSLLKHPQNSNHSPLIKLVEEWEPNQNFMRSLSELREQRILLTDIARRIEHDLSKLIKVGASYNNNKRHNQYIALQEDKNEVLYQRDVVDARIENIEQENDITFKDAHGMYLLRFHEKLVAKLRAKVGDDVYFNVIEELDSEEAEKVNKQEKVA